MKNFPTCLVCFILLASNAEGSEADNEVDTEYDAEVAFEILKGGLVGEWQGKIVHSSEPVEATFYMTGNESAIVEYIRRPKRPAASMSTVYHLADEYLQLTHYCSMRNQPRLRAHSISADSKTITFGFVDITNLSRSGNRYTHKMVVSILDRQNVSVTYVGLDDEVEGELTVELTRVD